MTKDYESNAAELENIIKDGEKGLKTLLMDDEELVDEDDSEEKSEDDEDEAMEEAEEEEESEGSDMEESNASDVDDAEMFAMDDRLAAAFKAMAPRRENKVAAHMATAFRLKLADLLLFTLSSQNTPMTVKVHMIIPLLKLAKLQLKQDSEGLNSRKTISLLNIIARLKKAHLLDDEVVDLLDQLIKEGAGLSNPTLVSAVASLSSFICSLGISTDGSCSDTVVDAFVNLFERFMTQEDGLIGCELAIAAVIKHPEIFVPRSKVFLKAGFNNDYRIFRRTEAILCLAGMLAKSVQTRVSVEKSTVKGVGKSCTEYLSASLADPDSPTLQKHLSLDSINENESNWNTISKKINAACQQICGKSPSRVLDSIQNAIS
ncbi:hypothetical protein OESDEN_20284 [Oesophagostomum dentatum]|uniref:Uncharacterized protein n=1 Tax=Oesophagostomum dentatum TaxID=61180 RepID=A0A0B1S828_OESDE|nr:hypothetical protein OESDEN_20284 [Oesophagostomum dentatum]